MKIVKEVVGICNEWVLPFVPGMQDVGHASVRWLIVEVAHDNIARFSLA